MILLALLLPQVLTSNQNFSKTNMFGVSNILINPEEIKTPKIESNGQYSSSVVETCFQVYLKSISKYASEYFDSKVMFKSAFSCAKDELSLRIKVDHAIIFPSLANEIILYYNQIASAFNQKTKNYNINSEIYRNKANIVKEIIIFVLESYKHGFNISIPIVLNLVEFIYRFADTNCDSTRFSDVIKCFYQNLIEPSHFIDFFHIILKYFDQSRPALPIISLKDLKEEMIPVKNFLSQFLIDLSQKVIKINCILHSELFNRHSCMLITSMMSCYFYEELLQYIIDLFNQTNLITLIRSKTFAKTFNSIAKFTKDSNSCFVELLARHLSEKHLILSFQHNNYLDFGSLLCQFYSDHRKVYDYHFERLEPEVGHVLTQIRLKYSVFWTEICKVALLNNLETDFRSPSSEKFVYILNDLDLIINIFPEFSKHDSFESSIILSKIFELIPKLVKISMSDLNPDWNLFRLEVLIKLIKLSVIGNVIHEHTSELVSKVVLFFNFLVMKGTTFEADTLNLVYDSIVFIFRTLADNNIFFNGMANFNILHNFHKNSHPVNYDECTILILVYNFWMSLNKKFAFAETIKISSNLQMNIKTNLFDIIIYYIAECITEESSSVDIHSYRDGMIIFFYRLLVQENLVSKTQRLLLENFIVNY